MATTNNAPAPGSNDSVAVDGVNPITGVGDVDQDAIQAITDPNQNESGGDTELSIFTIRRGNGPQPIRRPMGLEDIV